MKARCVTLAERSLNSVLSAIEIYNKPDFKDREQIFAVLLAIGWEVLVKARVIQQNGNKLTSIYVKDGHRYKPNRIGTPMTIDVFAAMRKLNLDPIVSANVERLVEIRDAAVHLTAQSVILPRLLYSLGAASLQNYCKLVTDWFGFDLKKYNFFILPLGFNYPFQTFKLAQMSKESADVLKIVRSVIADQEAGKVESGGFQLVCELKVELISAKKLSSKADVTAAIAQTGDANIAIVHKQISKVDNFPFSYSELWRKVKDAIPGVKQGEVNAAIKVLKLRGDGMRSDYNYRNKTEQKDGPRKNTPVIYNETAFVDLVAQLEKEMKKV